MALREKLSEQASSDPIERARQRWVANELEGADMMVAMTSLVRAEQIMESRIDEALKPFGLNQIRYNALMTLNLSRQGRPMGRVAWGLMIHPATVTAVIDRLERDRLVERRPHPDDRRAILAVITEKGRSVANKATKVLTEIDFGLDGLTPSDARNLTQLLRKLRFAAGDISEPLQQG